MKKIIYLIFVLIICINLFAQKDNAQTNSSVDGLEALPPDFNIIKVHILSSNSVQLYATNDGAAADYIRWYIETITNYSQLNSSQKQIIETNTATNCIPITLSFTTGALIFGKTYNFVLDGSNSSGYDETIFAFTNIENLDPNFRNTVSSTGVIYPIDNDSEISGLNDYQKQKSSVFYNSAGKQSQAIVFKGSYEYNNQANLKDVVSPIVYDEIGKVSKSYLPYIITTAGTYRTDALTEQNNFYTRTTGAPYGVERSSYSYAENIYQKSPLTIPLEQGFPGQNYQPSTDHTIRTSYEPAAAGEVLILNVVEGTGGATIDISGYYPARELHKTKIIDENQVVSYVYKDRTGKEILKKVMDGTDSVKTYYVYDKYDRLRFILPPELCKSLTHSTADMDPLSQLRRSWVTEYKYDGLNREVEKIMPEEEPVWTIYDPAGRVILRQDGIMRVNYDWLFTKYDRKGRVIMTGIYHRGSALTRQEAQDTANNKICLTCTSGPYYKLYEDPSSNPDFYYTNQAFPNTNNCTVYTINYYDDYDFNNDGTADSVFQTSPYNSDDFTDALYPNYKISGHSAFYRINDKITLSKTLLFGSEGTSRVYNGNNDYNYNPPSPETIYYQGTVRLLPGFKTYPDQKVYIGPNISVPPGTSNGNGEYLASVYYYDKYGRVIQTRANNHIGGSDVSNTQYDYSGKVIRSKVTHSTSYGTVNVEDRFTYDVIGRLLNSYKKIDNLSEKLVSVNEYNELGQLITKKLDNISGEYLQTVDYRYNIRGWLKSMNDPYSFPPPDSPTDAFAFTLHYEDDAAHGIGNLPLYNGNISTMTWKYYNDTKTSVYKYDYDKLNRLKSAQFGDMSSGANFTASPNYKEYDITYDKNGNINTLKRNSYNGALMDNLLYSYADPSDGGLGAGNKLYHVTDAVSTTSIGYDFEESIEGNPGADYSYDDNGNMTGDLNKGITISYNYLNLPTIIDWTADGRKIEWLYDATGSKLRKTVYNADGEATMVTDYVNGFVYNTNYGDALPQLSFFGMSEGRVVKLGPNNYELQYWLKDHLGNTRIAVNRDANDDLHIIQKDFYYPFGLTVNLSTTGDENKFKYNGKELEDEHGLYWYHYGVRYYDPQLGRWHTMDPADEFHSPYLYVGDNPILWIDPDGAQAATWAQGGPEVEAMATNPNFIYDPAIASQGGYCYKTESQLAISQIMNGINIGQWGNHARVMTIAMATDQASWISKISHSDNLIVNTIYNSINSIYIGIQAVDFGLLEQEEWTNPFTGANFGNLDGSANYKQTDNLVDLLSYPVSYVRGTASVSKVFHKTKFYLPKLNAAEFSQINKGGLSRLSPAARGLWNRGINWYLESWNQLIDGGMIFTKIF